MVDRRRIQWSTDGMISGFGQHEDGRRAASDTVLAGLHAAPYLVSEPDAQTIPFVFASPHSGRVYPQGLLQLSRLSAIALRRSEDAYVDTLFADAVMLGAPLIAARFPRAWLDVNRAPGELDPAMFDGKLTVPLDQASPRVNAGLGVIPRIVRDGAEIYRVKLKPADAEERLTCLHASYHRALAALVRDTHLRFATAVVIDCHSMPSAAPAPDVVLGDRYGTAASHALLRRAEQAFQSQGFTVGRNVPYAGGYTTHLYGQPAKGIHALQIEVNRALYLDEDRIEMLSAFPWVRGRLTSALRELVGIDANQLRIQDFRLAAE
jgi:N-formylglutamate amidohydrolase